jgi:rare lipoprotein A
MRAAFAVALGLALLSGCAKKRTARRPPPPPPAAPARTTPPPVDTRSPESAPPPIARTPATVKAAPAPSIEPLYVEKGIASWYGHPYHGRIAANGERYDMEELTAAHRTLPFDTRVRVVNTLNEKTVDVRITDRGPFIDGRIIDLSRAAARAIELIGPGIAPVRVEVTSMPETAREGIFAVQVGAFRARENAERARIRMAAKYGVAKLVQDEGLWRVIVGAEKTEERADALCRKIRQESGEKNAFVVRLDS